MTADKRYDGTAGKIFGYGTTYYYWTGKQGTANSSTSSLKADYGIDIGFLGNGQGSGNINVTSNQDMVWPVISAMLLLSIIVATVITKDWGT